MANISETSINRPVLSTVMMLVILLFGMIGYKFLGVREFPQCGPAYYLGQRILSGSECRGYHEPDHGAVGAEYQRYTGYPFVEQCQ